MRIVLIDAQTAAATASVEIARSAAVATKGLAGAETIAVNMLIGSTYEAVFDSGAAVTLSATNPQIAINQPGTYQFVKGTTDAAVTVQVTI